MDEQDVASEGRVRPRGWWVLYLTTPLFMGASFLLGYYAKPDRLGVFRDDEEARDDITAIAEAYGVIHQKYDGALSPLQLRRAGIGGLIDTLDEYSEFFTREEWARFEEDRLKGEFGGIGVVFERETETGQLVVQTTFSGTPASAAGVFPGDRIIAVDGQPLLKSGTDDIVQQIRGDVGSDVRLTIRRKEDKPFDLVLKRALIDVPALAASMLDPLRGIGYIRVIQFSRLLSEFQEKYAELERQGMKGVVIDLRFNGGGALDESVALADEFLESGVIVSTRGRDPAETRTLEAKAGALKLPVVILVNEFTASASEILAGALRDHGRAMLVGTRTFGKGLVQSTYALTDESHLKITTSHYYTPAGICVQREPGRKDYGLEPDVHIDLTKEEEEALVKWMAEGRFGRTAEGWPVDPQRDAAVEIVMSKLEGRVAEVKPRVLERIDANPGD